MQQPVIVLSTNTERESGHRAQASNISAAKTVADIIRTCLGPQAMLKMLLDPMGGIVLTNDGNAILREIEVSHPAAKSMIELSRTQDEEVGDGTTSVIILAGEMLAVAEPFLQKGMHPTVIIQAYSRALEDALRALDAIAKPISTDSEEAMKQLVKSCLATKYTSRWGDLMCHLALEAVKMVAVRDAPSGRLDIDLKRYARVEKIPGGEIEDSEVLDGIMLNKDIVHPKMRRRIDNPRVLLLDCSLEYKKAENSMNIEISQEADFARILKLEEDAIMTMCEHIIAVKPDVVVTEKGLSDLAAHYLMKANITAIRRVRKTDNNRIARATGASIVHEVEDIKESDVGTKCGLFEVRKIGDEYFTYMIQCQSPKACTILLRGASKDIMNEVERNLQDAMNVARNVLFDARLVPGGGAAEFAMAHALQENARRIEGIQQWPYAAVADALEVIPRTLAQNCGAQTIRVLTELRALHAQGKHEMGIDGMKGTPVDMRTIGIMEPLAVKAQTIKTAIDAACLLLRVDDIVSGMKRRKDSDQPRQQPAAGEMENMAEMG